MAESTARTWSVDEVSVSIGGIEMTELVDISYDPADQVSMIPSIKGPVGYNLQHAEEPTWSVTVRPHCEQLPDVRELRKNHEIVPVVIKTPTSTVNCYDAIVVKVAPTGAIEKEAPGIKIEGKALKIEETDNA